MHSTNILYDNQRLGTEIGSMNGFDEEDRDNESVGTSTRFKKLKQQFCLTSIQRLQWKASQRS